MIKACIFDLDGVIVDTAKYHYLAWRNLANRLGFEFTPEQGEATKGVSRMASLDIVLRAGGMEGRFSESEKAAMAAEKNDIYLQYINRMSANEVLAGVLDFLHDLHSQQVKVALGSASRNAPLILERCGIAGEFDAVIDGNVVTKAKPEPDIFLAGAKAVGCLPEVCVVFEDAEAGIEAATRGGMRSVGVGTSTLLNKATMQIATFEGFTFQTFATQIDKQ